MTGHAPLRPVTRLGLAGSLAVLSLVALLGAAVPGHAAPPDESTVTLSLTAISPVSVSPGQTLRIDGRITTDTRLVDAEVSLEVGTTPFVSRSSIAEAAGSPPLTTTVTDATDRLGTVPANDSSTFSITIPTDDLPLGSAGVYPLRVVVSTPDTFEPLTDTRSFLPWVPEDASPAPSRLLMFWPLIDLPRRDATGAFTDPGLGGELAPGGRLTTLQKGGAASEVSWVIDPSLLADVESLGTPRAERWLRALPSAVGSQEAVVLPYGDPDLAAVTDAGQLDLLRSGSRHGSRIADRILARPVRTDVGWPADGAADTTTIDRAHRAGFDLQLLDESITPLVTPLPYTPSGRVTLTDPDIELLLIDRVASSLVASPANTTDDVVLSRQRFLAETLLHSLELPSDSRLMVIAPPRRWDPSPRWTRALAEATQQATWLNPVTIDEALKPSAPTVERFDPTPPTAATERQLPVELVNHAAESLPLLRKFAAILTRPNILARPIQSALYTSVSTAWRPDHDAAATSQDATVERLTSQRARVRIVSKGGTLSDDRGELPVTIRNQLDQDVRVKLAATSEDPLRLRVDAPTGPIRVKAQGIESVSVSLDAVTSGRLTVQAQILTPDRRAYSDPVPLDVDVRAYGQVALLVFGAAAALMIAAAVVRTTRRIRRSRQAAT